MWIGFNCVSVTQLRHRTSTSLGWWYNDGASKDNLHFGNQSKQVCFCFLFFFMTLFSKRTRKHVLLVFLWNFIINLQVFYVFYFLTKDLYLLKLKIVTQWDFLLTEMLNLLATCMCWNFFLCVFDFFFLCRLEFWWVN